MAREINADLSLGATRSGQEEHRHGAKRDVVAHPQVAVEDLEPRDRLGSKRPGSTDRVAGLRGQRRCGGTTPSQVERQLQEAISVPTRHAPDITLEELDGNDLVLKIAATPLNPQDGAQLAADVLEFARRRGEESVAA
jgi:hypothetical protein